MSQQYRLVWAGGRLHTFGKGIERAPIEPQIVTRGGGRNVRQVDPAELVLHERTG